MTIDERLEFLLKSSESLHANLQELIAADEKRWAEREKRSAEQERRWKEQDLRWEKTDARIDKLTKVMAAIGNPILDHEKRLEGSGL